LTPEVLRHRVRALLAEQRALVSSLLALREQLQGSVFARYGVCGKPGCLCREGRRHGPYYVFSARLAGRGAFAYLTPGQVRDARSLLGRHREFRKGLARLKRLNEELVHLLRRYQEATSRRGGRRLGIVASV
jgi:hypothetical protein